VSKFLLQKSSICVRLFCQKKTLQINCSEDLPIATTPHASLLSANKNKIAFFVEIKNSLHTGIEMSW